MATKDLPKRYRIPASSKSGRKGIGVAFLELLVNRNERVFRQAVEIAARAKARALGPVSSEWIEEAYQDTLVLAYEGRCKDLDQVIRPQAIIYFQLRRLAGSGAARRFLDSLLLDDRSRVASSAEGLTTAEDLEELFAKARSAYRMLIGYLAATVVNVYRTERRTGSRRAHIAMTAAGRVSCCGFPPLEGPFEDVERRLIVVSVLREASAAALRQMEQEKGTAAAAKLAELIEAHFVNGTPVDEALTAILQRQNPTFSRASAFRYLRNVRENIKATT